MTVKERIENLEIQTLSSCASLSKLSRGRVYSEIECDLRTAYQKDRDKIIHSKAFRRLKHKTQVFIFPEKDHYRTRLTHTLEVSQIGRTIARALRVNEDLTESIALAHDLGHTPFGHLGEDALNEINLKGFKHYEQSLRVVDELERLNLTHEVRDGILCHTCGKEAYTLEGRIVKIADKLAYLNHDIDDAIRANVLNETEIPKEITEVIGKTCSERIDTVIHSIVENTIGSELKMAKDVSEAFYKLNDFMYKNVYWSADIKNENEKIYRFIKLLFNHFKENPKFLPEHILNIAKNDGIERAVCDYIAGMTDRFARKVFENIFIPKSWSI